jgi:hypothetical protein
MAFADWDAGMGGNDMFCGDWPVSLLCRVGRL